MTGSDHIAPRSYSLEQIAQRLNGSLRGDGTLRIDGINSLEDARPHEITFIAAAQYAKNWGESKAGAALVSKGLEPVERSSATGARPLIFVQDAEIATITLLEMFQTPEPMPALGAHASAVIHHTAKIGQRVRIGPHVSIDAGVSLGDDVVLHAGVRLYENVQIGQGSVLHANVVVRHGCKIGRRVILHQQVSIGADGFGYRPDPGGAGLLKVPHIGNVILEDAVEIGANSCVDRAKFGSTIIGAGTKVDNLVQIAHNCRIGRACVIAGCSGLGGSVTVGDGVQIAGGIGIIDHVTIGSRARIGAYALVTRDVPAGESWLGIPADEGQTMLRQWASVRKLPGLLRRLSKVIDHQRQDLRPEEAESRP